MQPKKPDIRKINLKNQKGSITLFVLVAILFFLIIVLSVYTSNQNKKITQLGQVDKIIKDYEKDVDNIDQIYEDEINEGAGIDFETNFIKSSSINSENKIYYDIDSWTNEDIVVEIVLKDETFGPDVQIIIKSDSTGLENIYTYDEAKKNEVIITENSEVIIKIKDEEKEYHLTKFDKEKPIVSYESFFEKDGSKYTSGNWTNKETYTKIQAIENISGIETIEYSNDKNTWKPLSLTHSSGIKQQSGNTYFGEETWTLQSERIESVYFRVKDLAGNYSEPSNVFDIRYDTVAPTIPEIVNDKEGTWASDTMNIQASSTDAISKVAKIEYSYDNINWKDDWDNPIQLDGNKASVMGEIETSSENKIYIKATDNAGNVSDIAVSNYKRDNEKPTVNISPNGGNYLMPVVGNAVIETKLDAQDTGGSGLEILQYGWSMSALYEPDEWIDFKNGDTIRKSDITTPGTYYLWTNVLDKAGNKAEEIAISDPFYVQSADINTYQIKIIPSETKYTNQNVIGTVEYGIGLVQNKKAGYGTDLNSAKNAASDQSPYLITAPENGIFYASAQDAQGNIVEASLEINNIDKIPPIITVSKNGETTTMPISGKATISTQITVTDEGVSGVDDSTLVYGFSNSKEVEPDSWEPYKNGETINKDIYDAGTYYLWVKAQDIAGNPAENFKVSEPFVIEPNSEADSMIIITRNPEGWTNQNVIGTIKYGKLLTQNRKAGWGLTEAEAMAAANSATAEEVTVTQNGYIYAEATDEYGTKVTNTLYVDKIDKTPPKVSLTPNGGTYFMPTVGNAKIKTIISASDETNGSGLDILQYGWSTSSKVEPSTWQTFTNNTTITKSDITQPGTYYLWTKVTDMVGNEAVDIKVSNAFTVLDSQGAIKITANPTTPTINNVIGTVTYSSGLVENTKKAGYGKDLYEAKNLAKNSTAYTVTATDNGYFYATAEDAAGNVVETSLQITNIDRIAPKVTLNPNGGTYTITSSSSTTIKTYISASDEGSGLANLQYGWSNSATTQPSQWYTFTNNTTIMKSNITSSGNYYLWTNVTDKAGNRAEDIKVSQVFRVVETGGQITITPTTTNWTNQTIYGDVTYSDSLVESTRKAGFGTTLEAAKQAASTSTAYRVPANQNGFIYATAQDELNNVVEKNIQITTIDKEDPKVSFSVNGGQYAMPTTGYGQLKTNVTVSDTGGSGINTSSLRYGWSTSQYSTPSTWKSFSNGGEVSKTDISSSGNYYLWIKAEDNAGNAVEIVSSAFNMGNYNISFSYKDSTWSNQNVTTTVTYPNVLSENRKAGYGSTLSSAQNNASSNTANYITATGTGYFYAEATDVMGNKVTANTQITKIDTNKPTVNLNINGGNYAMPTTGYGQLKTNVTVSDTGGSGINTSSLRYGWSTSQYSTPSTWKSFSNGGEVSKTDISSSGNYYLWIQAEDNAGNTVEFVSSAFNMGDYEISISYGDSAWSNTNVTTSVTYPSILSQNRKAGFGTTLTYAQNNASTYNAYSITATQTGYFYAEATDTMGNKVTNNVKVNIEKTPPTVTISPDEGTYVMPTYGSATITVTITASDTGGSGLKKLEYGWAVSEYNSPTSWTEITSGKQISKSASAGTYYLCARATDNAGNQTTERGVYRVYSNSSSDGKITITPEEKDWTNKNFNVNITYGAALLVNTRKAGFGTTLAQAKLNVSTSTANTITVSANGYIYAVAEDSSGREVTAQYQVTNIDKVAPTINQVYDSKEIIQDGLVYNLNGENNTGSGHSSTTRTWKDLSGNGMDGTISGATWSGNALSFDGNDDYVTFDNPLNAQQLTFEVTASFDDVSAGQLICNIEWGGEALSITNGKVNLGINYDNKQTYETATASTTCQTGKTYTIAGTYDGRNLKIYVNGVLEGSRTVTSGTHTRQKGGTIMALGKNPYGTTGTTNTTEMFDGKMYTARMYSRALSAEEIKQNYYADQYIADQYTQMGGQGIDTLSGLAGYQFSTSSTLTENSSGWIAINGTTSTYQIPEQQVSGSGNIYLYLKDKAGNVTKKRKIDMQSYTITYNDGNGHTSRVTKYAQEEIGSAPVTFRQGYYFNGWYTAQSGGTKVDETSRVTGSKTIYGHWTAVTKPTITFSVYVDTKGWVNNSGTQAGTTGQSLSINAIKIDTSSSSWIDSEITYSIHNATIGDDLDWKYDGAISGNTSYMGQAFRVILGGKLERHFDLYYRAHVQDTGWLGWVKDGEYAGTTGQNKRMEAIQIQLVPKGSSPS